MQNPVLTSNNIVTFYVLRNYFYGCERITFTDSLNESSASILGFYITLGLWKLASSNGRVVPIYLCHIDVKIFCHWLYHIIMIVVNVMKIEDNEKEKYRFEWKNYMISEVLRNDTKKCQSGRAKKNQKKFLNFTRGKF